MSGSAAISGNTAFANGGGVVVDSSGTFEMTNGTIGGASTSGLGNTANSSTGGGGVVVKGGTYMMSAGSVSGNTVGNGGGGVSIINGGTFTKANGGTIDGDTDNTHTTNSATNTVTSASNGGMTNGHAVRLVKGSVTYYRDSPLGAGQDINSTDTSTAPSGPWNQ
jgi:hypothetical protein